MDKQPDGVQTAVTTEGTVLTARGAATVPVIRDDAPKSRGADKDEVLLQYVGPANEVHDPATGKHFLPNVELPVHRSEVERLIGIDPIRERWLVRDLPDDYEKTAVAEETEKGTNA